MRSFASRRALGPLASACLAAAAWLVAGVSLAACAPNLSPYASSPQWRDGHFHNPADWPRRTGVRDVIKWRLQPRPPANPRPFVAPYQPNDGQKLRANAGGAERSVTFIGHATTLVQAGGLSMLTDPVFSDDVGGLFHRYAPPGVALHDLPPIDLVVISHNHRDHLDEASVRALGPSVHFVVPLGLGKWFRARGLTNVTELDWWQSTLVDGRKGGQATVTLVPAQHWSQRLAGDRNQSLWGGYVIDAGGQRVFFAGDTGYPAAFAEVGRRFPGIDLAILPIGAYAPRWFMHPQHMAPEETARAFRDLGARVLLPVHWATFHLSDEPMDEPPRLLYQAMGPLANRILFLPIGGSWFSGGLDDHARR
jgi:L-ascorbate metabolism protein UlaG (beta-lactamase superfamily)